MRPIPTLLAFLTTAAPASGQPLSLATKNAGNAAGAVLLAGMDADRSGTLKFPELATSAGVLVMTMDVDGSGHLTREEMAAWSGGVRDIAAHRDRMQAHETMAFTLFDFADPDANGRVTVAERVVAAVHIAARAGTDDVGVTTTAEFDRHSIVAIGLRNAEGSLPV